MLKLEPFLSASLAPTPPPPHRTLQQKSHLYIPRKGIARPQSQFLHTCVCERFIYSRIGPHIFLQQNRDRGNIAHCRQIKVEIGTVALQFLFREYFLQIFGIVSLQCSGKGMALCTVNRFVSISAKFGICTVVCLNGTLVEAKIRTGDT